MVMVFYFLVVTRCIVTQRGVDCGNGEASGHQTTRIGWELCTRGAGTQLSARVNQEELWGRSTKLVPLPHAVSPRVIQKMSSEEK